MDKALQGISALLERAQSDDRVFPATLLFSEGWMLRLVLQWFADTRTNGHELTFAPGAKWFSEARLASPFLRDKPREGYTCADGVIGHFRVSKVGKAKLSLERDAQQFVVIEAKMFSGLSKGTKYAPAYNQAARNVACMAEIVRRTERDPPLIPNLAFLVIAPELQRENGTFGDCLDTASLKRVIQERALSCDPPKLAWFDQCKSTIDSIRICCLSWESVIAHIKAADATFGDDLEIFYEQCLQFNRLPAVLD